MIVEKLLNHSPGQTVLSMCDVCGALIGDPELHEQWHTVGVSGESAPVGIPGPAFKNKGGRPPKNPVVSLADMPDPTDAILNDPNEPNPIQL
ncbi:MAG: hypothetical protein WB777_14170 [Mycobacterium sp.]